METTLEIIRKKKTKPISVVLDLVMFGAFLYLLFLFLPIQLGGTKTYVILSGTSMEPNFSKGDLVVVKEKDTYTAGEVVLYKDPFIDNVFHRIVDVDSTKFVVQGDNNDWLDTYRPTSEDIKGALWIHIPKIGNYVNKLRTPAGIVITALILSIIVLSSVGIINFSTKDEDNIHTNLIEDSKMFEQNNNTSFFNRFSDSQISILSFVGILFLLAGFLAILGFSRPYEYTTNEEVNFSHTGEFSYTGAADPELFDSDQLQPGDPIFQNLNDTFDVHYDYKFVAQNLEEVSGTYSLSTVIGASNGWHRTFNIHNEIPFETSEVLIEGTIDLVEIRTLIDKMVTDTGYRNSSYYLNIEALVRISGSINNIPITEIHSSQLNFSYDPIQIKLAQSASDLSISEPQYLLKRVTKRSEVQIPFVGITVDTYALRIIGLGSSAIIASILIYLFFIWLQKGSPSKLLRESIPNSEAFSDQTFINEMGFKNKINEEIREEIFENKQVIEQLDEEKVLSQSRLEGSEQPRKRGRKKEQEKLSIEGLNILLSNKSLIVVESLNLEDYKAIKISNYKQLLGIADQEKTPIYHLEEETVYKFVITLPEKSIFYSYSAKKEEIV